MAHFLLIYDLADDYLERRAGFRDEHLALARAATERGELLVGGALAEPADQAILLFESENAAVAEAFATIDPYVTNGLVKSWRIRAWTTVAGKWAATPLR